MKALESLNTQTLLTEAQAQLATARASLAKARQAQGQEGSKIPGSDVIVTAISASAVEVKDAQGQLHTLTFGE